MFNKTDAYILLGDENRFYFTGFRSSFGCVILTEKEKYFLTDKRYAAEARDLVKDFRICVTNGLTLFDDAAKLLKGSGVKNIGYEDEYVTVAEFKRLRTAFEKYTLKAASADIYEERLIKRADEIEKIARAEAVTAKALQKVLPFLKYGVTEKEMSDEVTYRMLSLGAQELAFDNIVAFGSNTANPHHHPTDRKLEKGDLVTFDIGARVDGYCGDMTRTFCVGTPNEKLAVIHSIVLEAQTYALENLKAGMTGREAHMLAAEYIAAHGHGDDFTHSLGHGVGVAVHEAPYVGPRSDTVLQENMVVSVEPGIYVDGLGGARIEDLVVIKNGGVVNLTDFDKSINIKNQK